MVHLCTIKSMEVSFREILKSHRFQGYQILAGENGLDHAVRQVSVCDCHYHPDIIHDGILEKDDVYISCLDQFHVHDPQLMNYLESFIYYQCAGLIIVPTGHLEVLTEEVLQFCDEHAFPLVVLGESISYAVIMNEINRYLFINNANTLNTLRLEHIRLSHSKLEQQDLLHDMSPLLDSYIAAVFAKGTFHTEFSALELLQKYQASPSQILVLENHLTFILSDADEENLLLHCSHVIENLGNHLSDIHIGVSRIHKKEEIRQVLEEGGSALRTAISTNAFRYNYEPLNPEQLLFSVRDSREARDFYQAYVTTVSKHVSGESVNDFLKTAELFVANAGDYKKTAAQTFQHENTVRYRMNKIKHALGLEQDPIRFHEVISLTSQLRQIFEETS
ncbi:MAG: PucR family transcriptional regulator ligand-binding domain-containing protein [Clostridiales bacterium]|nr:PucR family transcriptional regulator ligand-binding domain-containing protein [Clostridiales bacterium]